MPCMVPGVFSGLLVGTLRLGTWLCGVVEMTEKVLASREHS